ncbi:hypothetical protein MDAP_002866 [Mitosporidium daphniae]|uniref:Post-GPI attachment to proteins factor 3 n=1 Tax=Mitosporidium daphniae TaxID=1485682 RepID=A0A098VVJ8_9MICR|nr:uncharacterized protein DI09_123p100 [Mitosporidium daphniae]KGG52930.1 hypothetical protein DI09_123p100 [Mitosporidium daphniae]|eukprot:XP_013239366.1 uncharacterized protein DI09_123p100 [Mitosporidium daphniae]
MQRTPASLFFELLTLLAALVYFTNASKGDRSPQFRACVGDCSRFFSSGPYLGEHQFYYPNVILFRLFQWNIVDECKYQCMHICESNLSQASTEKEPLQYFGKWPFIRVLGVQEFFSVLFSFANLFAHKYGYQKTRQTVHSEPLYKYYFITSTLTWISSAIFHSRDTRFTEFLDYFFAFASILFALFIAIDRVFLNRRFLSSLLRRCLGLFFLWILVFHYYRMAMVAFDYSLNMKVNAVAIVLHAAVWTYWAIKHPFYFFRRKILLFILCISLASLFEILDFPPFFGLIDAHALWHASTTFLVPLYWSFLRDEYEAANAHGETCVLYTKML